MIRSLSIALVAAVTLATPVAAQVSSSGPSSNSVNATWIDPNTGCSYARAQAAGYAPTWHLILNGGAFGLTNAHGGCPVILHGN